MVDDKIKNSSEKYPKKGDLLALYWYYSRAHNQRLEQGYCPALVGDT